MYKILFEICWIFYHYIVIYENHKFIIIESIAIPDYGLKLNQLYIQSSNESFKGMI